MSVRTTVLIVRGGLRRLYRAWPNARRHWRAWQARRNGIRFYRRFLPPNSLCFDVGANVGNRTDLFLGLGARVIAVEPVAETAAMLGQRFSSHPRLTILETALGGCDTESVLNVCTPSWLSTLSQEWLESTSRNGRYRRRRVVAQRQIPVTTLDQLVQRFGVPDFIKIDVEGFEPQVLNGLSQPVPALSFEFLPENLATVAACLEHLLTLGDFLGNYSWGESLVLARQQWIAPSALLARLQDDSTVQDRRSGDIYIRFTSKTGRV